MKPWTTIWRACFMLFAIPFLITTDWSLLSRNDFEFRSRRSSSVALLFVIPYFANLVIIACSSEGAPEEPPERNSLAFLLALLTLVWTIHSSFMFLRPYSSLRALSAPILSVLHISLGFSYFLRFLFGAPIRSLFCSRRSSLLAPLLRRCGHLLLCCLLHDTYRRAGPAGRLCPLAAHLLAVLMPVALPSPHDNAPVDILPYRKGEVVPYYM